MLAVPAADEDRALVTLVPHTTSLRSTRYEVPVSLRFLRPGAFDPQGIVTVPTVRLVRPMGTLTAEQLSAVVRGVCLWLGITHEV